MSECEKAMDVISALHAASVEDAGSHSVQAMRRVRRIQMDTGASKTFVLTDIEPFMEGSTPSNVRIRVITIFIRILN